jgi:hypothetical protein
MEERQYVVPGWAAIAAAALTLPMVVLGVILEIAARRNAELAGVILLPYILVALAQTVCGLYALGRLRTLLNERHGFHDVDGLITAIIVAACVLTLTGLAARVALVALGVSRAAAVYFTVVIFLIGLPTAALAVAFAVRLLRLSAGLGGLLQPFAYVTIASAACIATLVLAPLGFLLDAVGNVLLGMIFLRREEPSAPEFV